MSFPAFFRLLLLLFCCPVALLAQVKFVAQAPPTGTGEIRVQFVLSNAEGEDFTPPNFTDFNVLVGPSVSRFSSVSVSNVTGTSTNSSTTYTYILAPKRKGKLQIAAASVRVGGKTLRTQPLTVQVADLSAGASASASSASPPSSSFDRVQRKGSPVTERDLAVTVRASQQRVYEQEPVMLTYEIQARAGVGLTNVSVLQKPELKGFWTQEIALPRDLQARTERREGSVYQVATNLQYLLFPQQAGTLTIPAASFECSVLQRNEEIDEIDAFFNGMTDSYLRVQRHTQPLQLTVLPLPQPRPANFSGGVGSLKFNTRLLTPQPKSNDVATLRVSVEGQGNLRLIKAPRIAFPKGIESYEPKMIDQTKITAQGISGAVHFDYTFVPRNPGRFELPAVELVYFDTKAASYKTLRSAPTTLQVEKGTRTAEEVDSELALRSADIRPLQHTSSLPSAWRQSLSPGRWGFFLAALVACLLAFLLSGLVQRGVQLWFRQHSPSGQQSRRAAHRRLRQSQGLLKSEGTAFHDSLSSTLRQYLAEVLHLEKAALTRQSIVEQLQQRGLPQAQIEALTQLLDDIDFARFAPQTDDAAREQLLERAHSVLEHLQSLFS